MSEKKDHLDELLKDPLAILKRLHAKFGYSNCPLTAEAVFRYLESGVIRQAKRVTSDFVVVQCGGSQRTQITKVVRDLKREGHGSHRVITKHAGTAKEHSANLVNIRGQIYLVDAYNDPPAFTASFSSDWGTIEVSRSWVVKLVPKEKIGSARCD